MIRSIRLGLSVVAATLLFSSVGSAVSIFSETFTEPPNAVGLNVSPQQWTIVSGFVDVVSNSGLNTDCTAPSGNNCLDINGSGNVAGRIQSNRRNDGTSTGPLTLVSGHSYTFTFYVSGSNRNFGGVGAGNSNTITWRIFDTVTSTQFASGTDTLAYNVTAQFRTANLTNIGDYSNVRIEFDGGNDTDNVGLIIDDINLECAGANCAGIPEPATFALMGAGLAVLGLLRRR